MIIETPIPIMSGELVIVGRSWQGRPIRLTIGKVATKGAESVRILEETEYLSIMNSVYSPVAIRETEKNVSVVMDLSILPSAGSQLYRLEYLDEEDSTT